MARISPHAFIFRDAEAILPLEPALYGKVTGGDSIDIRAYKVCTFTELQTLISAQKTNRLFETVDELSFNDFTKHITTGNSVLVEVDGIMSWGIPDGHLYGPDENGRYWINVSKIRETLYSRGERANLHQIDSIERMVEAERDKTIKLATGFGSSFSINEMMVAMEMDAKSVNSIMDRFRGRQESLLSKWQLLGEILRRAEESNKDPKRNVSRIRDAHRLELSKLTSRFQAVILKCVAAVKDCRTPQDRLKGIREVQKIVVKKVLVGGKTAIDKFQKLQLYKKVDAQYIIGKDPQSKKVFDAFVK